MMHEIIYDTKFEDEKRLREIIARIKSRMESNMTGSGHTVADVYKRQGCNKCRQDNFFY